MCLIKHVEALLVVMSSLTRAKMASFIPEELTVDQIEQLKVSPEDSASAKDLKSPDDEGITYDKRALKELPDERIAQLEKDVQHVLGADYDRRKYSIFFDENLRKSDCLSVTLDGCEDFYEVVIQAITGLARQDLPISTRIMAILTKTNFGSHAAERGPAGPDVESDTQPPACWSRFMSICHEVYLVVEAELVQTWTQFARWFDELPTPDDPTNGINCLLVEPPHTLQLQPIYWSGSEESESRRIFHATVDKTLHAMASMEATVIDLICALTPAADGRLEVHDQLFQQLLIVQSDLRDMQYSFRELILEQDEDQPPSLQLPRTSDRYLYGLHVRLAETCEHAMSKYYSCHAKQ
jgi:hypothetical protein